MAKRAISQNDNFVRDTSIDFSDDGARFIGYRYRGIPCTYTRSDDCIYLYFRHTRLFGYGYKKIGNVPDGFIEWYEDNITIEFDNDDANGVYVECFNQRKWQSKNDTLIEQVESIIRATGNREFLEYFQELTNIKTKYEYEYQDKDMKRITDYPYSSDNNYRIISILNRCSVNKLAVRAKKCYDWNLENNQELSSNPKMAIKFRKDLERVLDRAGLDSYEILD